MAETAVSMYENGRSREGIWNCLELLVKEGSRSRDIKAAASYIRKLKTMSAPEALETIEFLIAGKRSIDTEKMYILKCLAAEDMSAEEFLNMLEELKYDIENKAPDYGADIILSTIHSAKGLEYDNVIIADAIDGILPGAEADVEEERRLFYVHGRSFHETCRVYHRLNAAVYIFFNVLILRLQINHLYLSHSLIVQ